MRGYQKRVVCIKKTDSPIISEAYFVLSDESVLNDGRDNFIKEANRIIEENTKEKKSEKNGRLGYFLFGLFCAATAAVILFFLTR